MALPSRGINRIGTLACVDPTRLTDLFDAFGSEVDGGGLTIFLRAYLKPRMGVFADAIGELAYGIGWCDVLISCLPVLRGRERCARSFPPLLHHWSESDHCRMNRRQPHRWVQPVDHPQRVPQELITLAHRSSEPL